MSSHPCAAKTKSGEATRFFEEVVLTHAGDDCLLWPFCRTKAGYARIGVSGKMRLAHRVVCEIINGPPPTPQHEAAHSCGHGMLGCVSPHHVSWKTKVENEADKKVHGTHCFWGRLSRTRLNEGQVRQIRSLKGVASQEEIGRRFGVTTGAIASIFSGRSWGWLDQGTGHQADAADLERAHPGVGEGGACRREMAE